MRYVTSLRWLLTMLLLVVCFTAYGPPSAHADDGICFPETGQCIKGRFRSFWEQNGGLAVFGYPTTYPTPELNRDTGQWYLTQWFERNRFEFHPENPAPYDVLLGRLGDDRLTLQGIDWQSSQRESGPKAGCLWFEQTGHNVCNQAGNLGFKTYWQTHGLLDPQLDGYSRSLALFGLPLTEPRMEKNASGDTVLTQWFERARFEWHPDKPQEYQVLLGLLGSELNSTSPRRITTTAIGQPAASEPFVYWGDVQDGTPKLIGLRVNLGGSFTLSNQVDPRVPPAAAPGGFSIAWVEATPDGRQQRVMVNSRPPRGYGTPVTTKAVLDVGDSGSLQIASMALGDKLYYTDATPGHSGLYARSLDSGEEELIDPNGYHPVVDGYWLLWSTKTTNGATGSAYRETWTLRLRNILNHQERVITTIEHATQGGFNGYSANDEAVVWAFSAPYTDNRVYLYEMSNGRSRPISPDAAGHPDINEKFNTLIVWATNPAQDQDPGTTWSIQAYDLRSGKIKTIVSRINSGERQFVRLLGDDLTFAIENGAAQNQMPRKQSLYLMNVAEVMGRP